MSKILKNNTGSAILINDTGVSIPASPGSYTIPQHDYLLWGASNNIVTSIGNLSIIVNDGSFDLGISDGIDLIKGLFPSSISVSGETTVVLNGEDKGERSSDSDTLDSILIELRILNKAISLSLLNGDEIGEGDV